MRKFNLEATENRVFTMRELNEKLIISIAVGLLVIGTSFIFFFPSQKNIDANAPSIIKQYTSIDIKEAVTNNSEWPEAKEQAEGEMFDLFTPPEIFINENGDFVFRPPYAINPKGPFGVNLLQINLDPYRFQLEGFVEEDRNDQSRTTILVHSVEDGKSLRLTPFDQLSEYGIKILDWKVIRNFNDDTNTQLVAWLKIEDSKTDRIINLRHDEQLYEDSIEIVFEASRTKEVYVLRGAKSSFFVEDIEYRLDSVDFESMTVLMTKSIPDSDPVTEILSIYTPDKKTTNKNSTIDNSEEIKNPASIEEAFNSIF